MTRVRHTIMVKLEDATTEQLRAALAAAREDLRVSLSQGHAAHSSHRSRAAAIQGELETRVGTVSVDGVAL